jgi:hypothetical protein
MSIGALALAVVLGLIVNEICDVSPWLARRLVRWSARLRYQDASRAQLRAEELTALINERPGKLLKLCTGAIFALSAGAARLRRAAVGQAATTGTDHGPGPFEPTTGVARFLFPMERFRGEWRYHWIEVARSAMGAAVAATLGATSMVVWAPAWIRPAGLAAIVVVGVVWCGACGLRWFPNRSLVITNKRLLVMRGIVRRKVYMVPLVQVADMSYTQSSLGSLLNYGTFHLQGGDNLAVSLRKIRNVPHPNEIYLRVVEEMYDPESVEARITSYESTITDPETARPTLIAWIEAMPDDQLIDTARLVAFIMARKTEPLDGQYPATGS